MKKRLNSYAKGLKMYVDPRLCRPRSARLIITQNCMLRCKMCTFWKEHSPEPSLELIKYWIKELADFGITDVDIGGGEPFLRKDLVEIVKEVKRYGMECGVTTSGWLTDKVPFPPVDRIEISVDGARPETHDKIRGLEGSWQKAINTIAIARKHNCRITQLNFTLQPDNYEEVVDFVKLAKKFNIPAGVIPVSTQLSAQARLSDELNEFDIPKLERLLDQAFDVGNLINNRAFIDLFIDKLKHGKKSQPCFACYNNLLIFANGDVYPCGNIDDNIGNLNFKTNLKDLYEKSKPLRDRIRRGEHERCSWCIYPDIITKKTMRSMLKKSLGLQK